MRGRNFQWPTQCSHSKHSFRQWCGMMDAFLDGLTVKKIKWENVKGQNLLTVHNPVGGTNLCWTTSFPVKINNNTLQLFKDAHNWIDNEDKLCFLTVLQNSSFLRDYYHYVFGLITEVSIQSQVTCGHSAAVIEQLSQKLQCIWLEWHYKST